MLNCALRLLVYASGHEVQFFRHRLDPGEGVGARLGKRNDQTAALFDNNLANGREFLPRFLDYRRRGVAQNFERVLQDGSFLRSLPRCIKLLSADSVSPIFAHSALFYR